MLISLLCSPQLSESQDIAGAQEVKTPEEKQEIEAPPASEEESCLWRVQLPFRPDGGFNW